MVHRHARRRVAMGAEALLVDALDEPDIAGHPHQFITQGEALAGLNPCTRAIAS